MLLHRDCVIVTPPKCASTSLHTTLCEHNGFAHIYGRYGNAYGPHVTHVHDDFRDRPIYLIVRDPYERLISLWQNWCRVYGEVTLDWYCHWLMSEWKDPGLSFFTMNLKSWIVHDDVDYKLVPLNCLNSWVFDKFKIELSKLNIYKFPTQLTDDLKQLVQPWVEPDLELIHSTK